MNSNAQVILASCYDPRISTFLLSTHGPRKEFVRELLRIGQCPQSNKRTSPLRILLHIRMDLVEFFLEHVPLAVKIHVELVVQFIARSYAVVFSTQKEERILIQITWPKMKSPVGQGQRLSMDLATSW